MRLWKIILTERQSQSSYEKVLHYKQNALMCYVLLYNYILLFAVKYIS